MATLNGVVRLVLSVAAIAVAVLGVLAVLDRMALDGRTAERRALLAREAELTARAVVPGSALACLDDSAGETVGNACEKAVFVDAATTAGAVAYVGARLQLLKDAVALGDKDVTAALSATRRAIALDRYGIAAQVLAARDGCTATQCDAFALVGDAGALKSNLKARAFDQYVSRYAPAWTAPPEPAVSEVQPAPAPSAAASLARAPEPPATTGHPVDPRWDFPSAASIPPVSIMNAEPPLPKEGSQAPGAQPGAAAEPAVPVPPKRPQAQAATPPAR